MPETMWWLTWQCRSDDRVADFGMDRGPEDTEVLPARICRGPGREGVIGVGAIEGFSIDVADPVRSRLGEDLGGFAEWLPGDEILAGGRVVPIDLLGGNEILPRLDALRRTSIVSFRREGRPSDGGAYGDCTSGSAQALRPPPVETRTHRWTNPAIQLLELGRCQGRCSSEPRCPYARRRTAGSASSHGARARTGTVNPCRESS